MSEQPTCYVCGEPFVLTKNSGDFVMETIMVTHAERDAVWTDVFRHVACELPALSDGGGDA